MPHATTDVEALQETAARMWTSFTIDLLPAAERFLDGHTTARQFSESWRAYYLSAVDDLDTQLSTLVAARREGGDLPHGSPDTDGDEDLLVYYPLSICHHNLQRLVVVLLDELGDRTADTISVPQRIYDLAVVLDGLDALYSRLVSAGVAPSPAGATPTATDLHA